MKGRTKCHQIQIPHTLSISVFCENQYLLDILPSYHIYLLGPVSAVKARDGGKH